jgi:hypothetical protein
MSEGSFFVKKNNDGCFQLKQRVHVMLFEAFKLVFETSRKIETEKGIYNQFSVSSKADIQKVINFFSFSGEEGEFNPLNGVLEYAKDNPFTYKRVKEFKRIVSNRKSYNYIKEILKSQYKLKGYTY